MSAHGFTSSMTEPLMSGVPVTADSVVKEPEITVPHQSTNVIVEPQQKCDLRVLPINARDLVE